MSGRVLALRDGWLPLSNGQYVTESKDQGSIIWLGVYATAGAIPNVGPVYEETGLVPLRAGFRFASDMRALSSVVHGSV